RYERAEPKVVINQQKGQPEVRIERLQSGAQGQQAGSAATQSLQDQASAAQQGQSAQQAQPLRQAQAQPGPQQGLPQQGQAQQGQPQLGRQDRQQQGRKKEQQQGAAAGGSMAAASRDAGDAVQGPGLTDEERERARTRFGVGGTDQPARNRQEAQM